jgi:hypothetical protein
MKDGLHFRALLLLIPLWCLMRRSVPSSVSQKSRSLPPWFQVGKPACFSNWCIGHEWKRHDVPRNKCNQFYVSVGEWKSCNASAAAWCCMLHGHFTFWRREQNMSEMAN